MTSHGFKKGITVLAAVLVFCSGCAENVVEEPQPEYVYSEVYRRIMEPCGAEFVLDGNMQRTVVGEHTYEFESAVDGTRRAEFISLQEKLCAHFAEHGIDTAGTTYRILEEYANRSESEEGYGYFGLASMGSWEQILTTLQASLGDYTNYGYLYALADKAAGELGWRQDVVLVEKAELQGGNASLLNLVYPCFTEPYAQIEEISACKALALELLGMLEEPYAGEDAFLQARADYAAAEGIAFTPTYLVFAYNGSGCPLKFRTHYLEVLRDSTYELDYNYTLWGLEEDDLASTETIIRRFEGIDEELQRMQTKLDTGECELIPVQLTATMPHLAQVAVDIGGICSYQKDGCYIYATMLSALTHEYSHYLYKILGAGNDPEFELWQNETLACYFGIQEEFQRLALIYKLDDANHKLIREMAGKDFDEPHDLILLLHTELAAAENPPLYYLKSAYLGRYVFADYFVQKYGEEAFLQSMLAPSKTKEYTGKELAEIVEEWNREMLKERNN